MTEMVKHRRNMLLFRG